MKIIYIKLKGYIGIYNGLGLNEIEIDLSASRHKIIVLSGINGCGKSTLLKAMTILPDNSSDYIPGVHAEKDLKVIDGNNIYDIAITSAAAKSGRGLSKASIIKNGIELNPNGNISSYKEIIFQEFDLDSNFIALSRLSSEDRGLADKSPAERKKFMSFIVESLDVYNGIYKNLNKKATIFKSHVNNLHTKIQNIGDEEVIRANVSALISRRDAIKASIENLKNAIIESQTILRINDPNGALQQEYENAERLVTEFTKSSELLFKEFSDTCKSLGINPTLEDVLNFSAEKSSLIESHQNNIEDCTKKKLSLLEKRESISMEINEKQRKITELSNGINQKLRGTIDVLRKKVSDELQELRYLGVIDPNNTSKEELQYTFETIKMIVETVEVQFYYGISDDIIPLILNFRKNQLSELESSIETQQFLVDRLKDELVEVEADYNLLKILSNRPKSCKIDDCYFISNAYELKKQKYSFISIEDKLKSLIQELNEASSKLDRMSEEFKTLVLVNEKRSILDHVRQTISRNISILKKSEKGEHLVSQFDDIISRMGSFNEFKDLDDLLTRTNVITLYKQDISSLSTFESELAIQSNSEKIIEQYTKELESLTETLNQITRDLTSVNNEIYRFNSILNNLNSTQSVANKAKQQGEVWYEELSKLNDAEAKLREISEKSKASISILDKICNMNNEIVQLQNQLQPLEKQISETNGLLVMLDSYKSEYQMYSDKYNLINTLKQYSSPTSGIQTLFMNIYMSKTLELANRVLGMIFGGQYRLLDYVINANEFKIPFVGLGMRVDDISNGSTSQVCMMGMVMNLVLKYQASPRYNIASLDEIDGGLDTRNRLEFINVLYKLVDILEIDQLFIISHSLELELSNVDMIRLKTYEEFNEASYMEGNILYDFNSSTSK